MTYDRETLRKHAAAVPVLALKAMACDMPGAAEAKRARVERWLVDEHPEVLAESRRIELEAGHDRIVSGR